jgi:hypothetical protein
MQDQVNATLAPKRAPWNKGKLTGAKPPLRPKHVWSIRTKLQIEGRARDLAMTGPTGPVRATDIDGQRRAAGRALIPSSALTRRDWRAQSFRHTCYPVGFCV